MDAGPISGWTATTAVPGPAAARALRMIRSVIDAVVFGLTTWISTGTTSSGERAVGDAGLRRVQPRDHRPDPLQGCEDHEAEGAADEPAVVAHGGQEGEQDRRHTGGDDSDHRSEEPSCRERV